MSDHSHYEELAALNAGGFLSDEERFELHKHSKTCVDCLTAEADFSELLHSGLPLTVGRVRETVDKMKTRTDDGVRSRFRQRARFEGIAFSPGVEGSTRHSGRRVGFFAAATTGLAFTLIALVFYGTYRRSAPQGLLQAQQQVDRLKRENSGLSASLSQLNESLAGRQREIQDLRAQLGNAAALAENLRRTTEQARGEAERSSSQNAQLLDEARNQEQMLAQARDEAASINQMRLNSDASLVEQEFRIAELSKKLRIASATLDMERQLTAAGKDVRELMGARELHVVDVHDTDSKGNPNKAFGRVFLTEGKSLTFYAFDLNEDRDLNGKRSFQVWAVPDTGADSARSLGFLHVDAKAQGRWVLKVDAPELLKKLNAVYVTAEPTAGRNQASGQKMLFAYLGSANHP
jgi:hypothetical protein